MKETAKKASVSVLVLAALAAAHAGEAVAASVTLAVKGSRPEDIDRATARANDAAARAHDAAYEACAIVDSRGPAPKDAKPEDVAKYDKETSEFKTAAQLASSKAAEASEAVDSDPSAWVRVAATSAKQASGSGKFGAAKNAHRTAAQTHRA